MLHFPPPLRHCIAHLHGDARQLEDRVEQRADGRDCSARHRQPHDEVAGEPRGHAGIRCHQQQHSCHDGAEVGDGGEDGGEIHDVIPKGLEADEDHLKSLETIRENARDRIDIRSQQIPYQESRWRR